MEFQLNPSALTNLFAVPCTVVDEQIRLAGAVQLKCLLCLLRSGSSLSSEEIAETLHISHADVIDALQYWVQAGVLTGGGRPSSASITPNALSAPSHTVAPTKKPTREDVIKRGAESKEIAFLLNEAQLRLGRLLHQSEMSTLVWLHDHEGLPVPVLLMVMEYAVREERPHFRFIEKTALEWASHGVETIEQAEEEIARLSVCKTAWYLVRSAFGLSNNKPTAKQQEHAVRWVNEMGFGKPLLQAAYEECVDRTGKVSFPYINKILTAWHQNGVHTKEDLAAYLSKESKASKPVVSSGVREVSYDTKDFEAMIEQQAIEQAKQLEKEE